MHIAISGAGIVGLASALYLAKQNHKVTIHEMHDQEWFDHQGYTKGKKIFIDLSARGLSVLSELNLLDEILSKSVKLNGRVVHAKNNEYKLDYSYDPNHYFIVTTDRKNIMNALIGAAEKHPNITILFDSKLTDLHFTDNKSIDITTVDSSGTEHRANANLLLGCDGKHSYVNAYIHKHLGSIQNISSRNYHYVELDIDNKNTLDSNYMHLWPSNDCFIAAQPNYDKSFSAALIFPNTAPDNLNILLKSKKLDAFLKEHFSNIYPYLKITHADDFYGSSMDMIIPSYINLDNILLLGDASHVMPPFLGQGVNSGLEDAQQFCHELARTNSVEDTIFNYCQNRIYDHDAICRLSRDAYFHLTLPIDKWHEDIESAVNVIKLNQELLSAHQDTFTSYHNYVCFTKMPYREIYPIKRLQLELIFNILNTTKNKNELLKEYKNKFDKIISAYPMKDAYKNLIKISDFY